MLSPAVVDGLGLVVKSVDDGSSTEILDVVKGVLEQKQHASASSLWAQYARPP